MMISTNLLRVCFLALVFGSFYSSQSVASAAEGGPDGALEELSLEDVLNLKLEIASKKSESLLEAPLSASVLTREDIRSSGARSIQEALRLLPGLIVRQQTNGNYDVVIRGLDNIPYGDFWPASANSPSLVMINSRVVYSYFLGGTFWETFPIAIEDVEQIEVIRGPAASLYGPNAVTGVVNILTRKPVKDGFSSYAALSGGTQNTRDVVGSVSYKRDLWSGSLSFNHTSRDRFSNTYYDYYARQFVTPDKLVDNVGIPLLDWKSNFPERDKALYKFGVNGYTSFNPSPSVGFELSSGYQDSRSQNIYYESIATPLSTRDSRTYYLDLKSKTHGLNAHVAFFGGKQEAVGLRLFRFTNTPLSSSELLAGLAAQGVPAAILAAVTSDPEFQGLLSLNPSFFVGELAHSPETYLNFSSDVKTLDADIDYEIKSGNFSLTPGIVYRLASYNGGYLSGHPLLSGIGLTARSEYRWTDWRFLASIRADKYRIPKKPYQSWQLAVTRQLGEGHLVRAVYSRANKFPSMTDVYLDASWVSPVRNQLLSSLAGQPVYILAYPHVMGDRALELTVADMFEVGYRAKLGKAWSLDSELFFMKVDNLPGFNNPSDASFIAGTGAYQVIGANAKQVGVTASIGNIISNSLAARLYSTVQYSRREQFGEVSKQSSTPLMYGGAILNYRPADRWNLNLNPYFLTAQRNRTRTQGASAPDIEVSSKLIINAAASYGITKNLHVFATARNLLNNKTREYAMADEAGGSYIAGVEAEF